MVHSSQSIMYTNVHNTVYTVYQCYVHCCTLYTYVLQCKMYSVPCTPMYTNPHYTVYNPVYLHIHYHETADLVLHHTQHTYIIHNNQYIYIYEMQKIRFTSLPLEAFLAWFDRYEHIFFPSQY